MKPRASFKSIDRGWNRIRATAQELERGTSAVRVGLIEGKGGDATREDGLTNAAIGATHEYGSSDRRVPMRPWLFAAVEKHREDYAKLFRVFAAQVLEGKMSSVRMLNLIGAKATADVKNYVTQGSPIPPPNAPSTVARKGSDRTLIDTGRMIGAVTWALEDTTVTR